MENLLVKLMFVAALAHLGLNHLQSSNCHGHSCVQILEKASREVLKVEWKPIVVFPDQAKRFR
jgi:hypothetical protein